MIGCLDRRLLVQRPNGNKGQLYIEMNLVSSTCVHRYLFKNKSNKIICYDIKLIPCSFVKVSIGFKGPRSGVYTPIFPKTLFY